MFKKHTKKLNDNLRIGLVEGQSLILSRGHFSFRGTVSKAYGKGANAESSWRNILSHKRVPMNLAHFHLWISFFLFNNLNNNTQSKINLWSSKNFKFKKNKHQKTLNVQRKIELQKSPFEIRKKINSNETEPLLWPKNVPNSSSMHLKGGGFGEPTVMGRT